MERTPKQGEIYQHFKGNLYRIVTLAQHTETGEQLVIYQALYGDYQVYARPLAMFNSKVDHEKYPEATAEYRFTKIPVAGAASPETVQSIAASLESGEQTMSAAERASDKLQEQPKAPEQPPVQEAEEEYQLDPRLAAFLDADSYQSKLEIFAALEGKADEDILNTIAVSLDLELTEGSLEEKYQTLKNCMLTLEKYECSRLR